MREVRKIAGKIDLPTLIKKIDLNSLCYLNVQTVKQSNYTVSVKFRGFSNRSSFYHIKDDLSDLKTLLDDITL